MKPSFLILISGCLLQVAPAQDDIPLLLPEERQAVDAQSDAFNKSLTPALTEAAKSTVRVWSGRQRLAYGTVVGDGRKVLTKWSEVARATRPPIIEAAGGEVRPVKVAGVFEDEDLVLLEITGSPLTPVKWSQTEPKLGSFLASPQPDGRPAAFGVVSVLERNLRDTDQAFLGIESTLDFKGPGVKIRSVTPESGAAAAGIRPGSVILKVGERNISGLLELKSSLTGVQPGDTITLTVLSRRGEEKVDVLLGNRPQLPNYLGDRLRQMERMGGPISRVRDSFTRVIQTDMRPAPDQIGGPVVDLQGRVVGISMARADRTRSFIMPSPAVEALLKTETIDPSLAQVRKAETTPALPVQRGVRPLRPRAGNPARMRQHLSEMQRLMDFMREEMEQLEPAR